MADRISLQTFEDELAKKLAESSHRPQAANWLGISWQGVLALLPLSQSGEITAPTGLQFLPHAKPWVMGVASLRGGLTLVVNWVRLLNLPAPTVAGKDVQDMAYWVGMNQQLGSGAALAVSHLLGLRGQAGLRVATDVVPTHAAVRQVLRDEQGQLWHELDLGLLLQSPDFMVPRNAGFSVPSGV